MDCKDRSVEELARELSEVDWEPLGFPQPKVGFLARRRGRFGL
jgi:hypothetical protein